MSRPQPTGMPDALAARYRGGDPIVLVGRYSSPHGVKARESAVNDLLGAVDLLATFGIDIRSDLPTVAELARQLKDAKPVRSVGADKKSFTNRFVAVDLRAVHGVYIVLSVGSGRKLDDEDSQPFVQYVTAVMRSIGACLILGRRIDRITRQAWALGPAMLYLSQTKGFIGDSRYGIRSATGTDSLLVFFSAQFSEADAEKLPGQTRTGMVLRTGKSMVNNRCAYSLAHPVPPGLMSFVSRTAGVIGSRVITFDTPSCRPAAAEVAGGVPEVFAIAADGSQTPVDQVANVRWALGRIGRSDWDYARIVQGLQRRQFSTDGLQRAHGPDSVLELDTALHEPTRVINTLLTNLSFYETGVLVRKLGVEGFEPIEISGCIPPDGPWATKADFLRIHAYVKDHPAQKRVGLALGGARASVDGTDCILISRRPAKDAPSFLAPVLASVAAEERRQISPGVPIRIDPTAFHAAIAQALANSEATPLLLLEDPTEPDHDQRFAQAQHTQAQAEVHALQDERKAILTQLSRTNANGQSLVTDSLLEHLNERFEEIESLLLPQAQQCVLSLEREESERLHARSLEIRGTQVDQVLQLVSTLRDPTDCTHGHLLLSSLRNVEIVSAPPLRNKRARRGYTLSFEFVIGDGAHAVIISGSFSVSSSPEISPAESDAQLIKDLCSGQKQLWLMAPNDRLKASRQLSKRLQISGRKFLLPNVADPRLARLGALVLFDPRPLVELAETQSEPLALLKRIQQIHATTQRSVWLGHPSSIHSFFFRVGVSGNKVSASDLTPADSSSWTSARNLLYHAPWKPEWVLDGHGYRLKPCPHCNHSAREPLRIPEADGLVCLSCRKDQSGLHWPADPYDTYKLTIATPIQTGGRP